MDKILGRNIARLAVLLLLGSTISLTPGCPCACSEPEPIPREFTSDANTIALWHLNEGTGQTGSDAGPGGYDLTLGASTAIEPEDPAWDIAKFGAGLLFSTNGQYAQGPFIPNALSNNQITVELWVKMNNSGTSQQVMLANNSIFAVIIDSTNHARFQVSEDGITVYEVQGISNVADGFWHYVAGTYNGNNSTLSLYIDGALEGNNNAISISLPDPTNYFIGGEPGSSTTLNGEIDEIRISNIARSGAEISNYYYYPFY